MVRMIRIPSIVGSRLKITTVEATVTITGVEATSKYDGCFMRAKLRHVPYLVSARFPGFEPTSSAVGDAAVSLANVNAVPFISVMLEVHTAPYNLD